jgi:integrase/recombinase XerD
MARNRQYADRVNVIKMVKVNGKWPFAHVVERNGRIIRDRVWVAGREVRRGAAAQGGLCR